MADRTPELQKAVVAALGANAGVAALVGDRIYDRVPQATLFPHISIGDVIGADFGAQGLQGTDAIMRIDVWSRAIGKIEARRIMAAVVAALHQTDLTLDAGTFVLGRWVGSRDMLDPDGQTTHGIVEFHFLTDG